MVAAMTARQVTAALYRHFTPRWAVLTEVSARPNYNAPPSEANTVRRIDVLLVRTNRAAAGGIERLAVEIKVTRADFLQDVRNPHKQAPWRALAHRHAYAVPRDLVQVAEVPAQSGLIVLDSRRQDLPPSVEFARRAPRTAGHDPGPLSLPLLMDAFYRAARAEAHMGGYGWQADHHGDDPGELRARIHRLEKDLGLERGRRERAQDLADEWRRRYAAHEPPACSTCGKPLHPARTRKARYDGAMWEHRDQAAATACDAARRHAAGIDDPGPWVYVPPPEPAWPEPQPTGGDPR